MANIFIVSLKLDKHGVRLQNDAWTSEKNFVGEVPCGLAVLCDKGVRNLTKNYAIDGADNLTSEFVLQNLSDITSTPVPIGVGLPLPSHLHDAVEFGTIDWQQPNLMPRDFMNTNGIAPARWPFLNHNFNMDIRSSIDSPSVQITPFYNFSLKESVMH